MKKLLLIPIAALLISCGYDCPEDYKGWEVVGYDYNFSKKMVLKKDCEYKSINLPDYYFNKYNLGDTIGRKTETEKKIHAFIEEQRHFADSVIVRGYTFNQSANLK